MFGMQDPRLNPMAGRPAWQNPGPVGPVQLTPGFRPPGAGGGAPGMMPQQEQGMPGMPMMPFGMPMMPFGMLSRPGGNEAQVNKKLDNALPGAQGDPMAQGAAQVTDMGGGGSFASWLKGLF